MKKIIFLIITLILIGCNKENNNCTINNNIKESIQNTTETLKVIAYKTYNFDSKKVEVIEVCKDNIIHEVYRTYAYGGFRIIAPKVINKSYVACK